MASATFSPPSPTARVDVEEASRRLRHLPYADLGFARGPPPSPAPGQAEAVYGPGKTADEAAAIVAELLAHGAPPVLLTRASPSSRRERSTATRAGR